MGIQEKNLITNDIVNIVKKSYIDYSMSVIINRALPDVRDGLKPVQRRILYAMYKESLFYHRSYDKCAGVVGEVLKNYHPHGDSSVYEALVRLAQKWVMRYPLISPQGNFGSLDGDAPAAYRYTECKLCKIAETLLQDIDENTVNFVPNYKESIKEPEVLPSALPNILLNGSTGIAVGMTTNIPPHNINEIIDAICQIIDNPNIKIDYLCKYILGPDFPTGGIVIGRKGIDSYLKTGKGVIKLRGCISIEYTKTAKVNIIINEIPYSINRANLVQKIVDLIQNKTLEDVTDVRDESSDKTRILIGIKKGINPNIIINKLYKLTPMETSFGVIMLAINNKLPKKMNIKEMLQEFILHRQNVVLRRLKFQLNKLQDKINLLESYILVLNNLNHFLDIIKNSQNRNIAKEQILNHYNLSDTQINSILEMRFYHLTNLEKEKLKTEYNISQERFNEINIIINNPDKLMSVIKEELINLKKKYSVKRLTQIIDQESSFKEEDIIDEQSCLISVSHQGFIKRTNLEQYRIQKRGGKGVKGVCRYENDFVENVFIANTHHKIMFFTNQGHVYIEKVYSIPEGSKISKGKSIKNIIDMKDNEYISNMLCIDFTNNNQRDNIVMVTKKGIIKKTNINAFFNVRKNGIIGIKIDKGDSLVDVKLSSANNDIIIITYQGFSIRFNEQDLKSQGRVTKGVMAINLKDQDFIKAMEIVNSESNLLIVSEDGQGKITKYEEYRAQGRGGKGMIAIKNSKVAAALSVEEDDEIMLLTKSGKAIRMAVKDIKRTKRATKGVRVINLKDQDCLVGISKVIEIKEKI